MSILLMTPAELAEHIAKKAKAKRLLLNLTQRTLATRSGVSYGTLKQFERTGKISLGALLKLALVLDSLKEFEDLFKEKPYEAYRSLDELLKEDKKRKRGRK